MISGVATAVRDDHLSISVSFEPGCDIEFESDASKHYFVIPSEQITYCGAEYTVGFEGKHGIPKRFLGLDFPSLYISATSDKTIKTKKRNVPGRQVDTSHP